MVDDSTKIRRIKAKEAEVTDKSGIKGRKPAMAKKAKIKKAWVAPGWVKTVGKTFAPIGRYFRNSWYELRQTKWPNRRSAWSLTLAVIIFSAFFAALILAFDALFDFIMKEVIL